MQLFIRRGEINSTRDFTALASLLHSHSANFFAPSLTYVYRCVCVCVCVCLCERAHAHLPKHYSTAWIRHRSIFNRRTISLYSVLHLPDWLPYEDWRTRSVPLFTHCWGRRDGPFSKVRSKMPTTMSKIWIWFTNSFSNNDNGFAKCAIYMYVYMYVCVFKQLFPVRMGWAGKDARRRNQHLGGHCDRPEILEVVYICLHRLSHMWLFVKGLSSLNTSILTKDETLTVTTILYQSVPGSNGTFPKALLRDSV